MTTPTLLQSIGIALLIFNLAACSGGEDGTEPLVPQQVVNEPTTPPDPPSEPPTEPPTEPPPPPQNPPPAPVASPAGIWSGIMDDRQVGAVILLGGETWWVYTKPGAPGLAEGLIRATTATELQTWDINGHLYRGNELDGSAELRWQVTGDGTWIEKQRFGGRLQRHGPPIQLQPSTVEFNYDTQSTQAFSLAQAEGLYNGLLPSGEEMMFFVFPDGRVRAVGTLECDCRGLATVRGSVATIEMTYSDRGCLSPGATIRGVIWQDRRQGKLYVAALSADTQQRLSFIGQKADIP